MGEEQIIIKAGPVGIVLGSRSREDMEKLRFLVSLAGTYEYVQTDRCDSFAVTGEKMLTMPWRIRRQKAVLSF